MNELHGSTLESLFDELGERDEFERMANEKIRSIRKEKSTLVQTPDGPGVVMAHEIRRNTNG